MDMKQIDQFNRFMGRATIDVAELLIIALKDVIGFFGAIQTILVLIARYFSSFRAKLKVEILEQHGADFRLSKIVFFQFKKLVRLLIDLNKKILISVFYSAASQQPLIPLLFTVGSLSWIWLTFQTQNFLLGVIGLIPMFMVFSCPVGLWYLFFN